MAAASRIHAKVTVETTRAAKPISTFYQLDSIFPLELPLALLGTAWLLCPAYILTLATSLALPLLLTNRQAPDRP